MNLVEGASGVGRRVAIAFGAFRHDVLFIQSGDVFTTVVADEPSLLGLGLEERVTL
jgi:hypothetical protein